MSVDDEQAGFQAAYNARQEVLRLLNEKGPKLDRVLLRLRQALNAKDVKMFCPKGGEIVYSKPLIAHNIRLQATKLALELHDAMPSQKHEHTGKDGEPLKAILYIPDNKRDGDSDSE